MAKTGKHNYFNDHLINSLSIRLGLDFYSIFCFFFFLFRFEQAWISEPSKQLPSTSSIKKIDHSSISIDTMNKQIKKPDIQTLQPQLQDKQQQKQQQLQQKPNDKSNQQHLTKRTSNTARINGDDIDVNGYHDFGKF